MGRWSLEPAVFERVIIDPARLDRFKFVRGSGKRPVKSLEEKFPLVRLVLEAFRD
jgi:hypothetical protein